MLEMTDVCYNYSTGDRALGGVSLRIPGTGMTAITGPNGSGKTTLGKIMAGIIKPTSGRAQISGRDTQDMSLGEIGRKIGYLFQDPERQLFAPTVEEELSFVLRVQGVPGAEIAKRVERMLERFHLADLRERFPFLLSRGEKQRLALAAVLVNRPGFLVLDEPTTALDLKRQRDLLDLLKELLEDDVGMVVISHDRRFVTRHASRVIELVGGEVIRDSE